MILEIFNALGIRPMQILIQLFGFLLVFGLMAKLLWKPILDLMDSREKEVRDLFAKAEEARRKTEELEADYKTRMAAIEEETRKRTAEGVHRGNELAEQIVADARKEAAMEVEKARNSIKEEAKKAKNELRDFAVTLSLDIAEKTLGEQVDKQKHENVVKKFLSELETLN